MTAAPRTRHAPGAARVYLLWAILALPAVALVAHDVIVPVRRPYLYWSGLFSCCLLVAALMVTPLAQLLGPRPWVRWLRANRRYLGVASFGYALLHLAYYLKNASLEGLLGTFVRFGMLAGWIGFAIMLVLAATSTDRSVDRLGRNWKRLHRLVYPAAALILLHWFLSGGHYTDVVVFTLPLVALSVWRLARGLRERPTA